MPEFARLPTRSLGLKFLLVCALAAMMGVPMLFVYGVSRDRLNRFEGVREETAGYEGGMQTVLGPVLLAPFEKQARTTNSENKTVVSTIRDEAVVFAETGEAIVTLAGEERRRGIYVIPVFKTQTAFTARFDIAEAARALAALDPAARYDWSKARIAMGASNSVGVLRDVELALPGGARRQMKPLGAGPSGAAESGPFTMLAADVGDVISRTGPFTVEAGLNLSGAERFSIAAFAKDTSARMTAQWSDPSFEGAFLPVNRDVGADGFTADWRAPLARRGIAEAAQGREILARVAGRDFAVRLVQPTNIYTGMDRALKYSMMFIGLVFLAYFMFEIVSGVRAHPAQYVMVGLAQAIFYLLLLAFAERIGFTAAFAIAAAATISLISLYVGAVFKQRRLVLAAFVTFALVYGLMYVLMQAEDYALLVGTVASFAALAALMYLTRRVNWYGAAGERERAAGGG